MDGSISPKQNQSQASKRRKVVERTVVTVKMGENGGKLKNDGPPYDSWSWRKYGGITSAAHQKVVQQKSK
ncbi:hypothetical protein GOBAR_DD16585 [Gossypium barbadense]|nr:hypothetical protein GOBAR_DD16585 [Gossypium barbadense]